MTEEAEISLTNAELTEKESFVDGRGGGGTSRVAKEGWLRSHPRP